MIPVVFDNCRGWLHPGASRRGIVICGAHGFEDLCARASLRLLAEEIAARGCPVLRFDWRGTADSEGDGDAPHRVATWLGNVGEAVRTLRERTGVAEIVLVGLRLGALLALEAARDVAPTRLVLMAPPASGRALKRELEVMSRVFQGKTGAAEDAGFDGVSCAGFRVSRATLDDLVMVGSRRFSGARDCRTLVLTQTADGSPLVDKLRDMGADVTAEPFEGYAEMMCDPTAALPPQAALRRIADFVAEGAGASAHPQHPSPRPENLSGNTLGTQIPHAEEALKAPSRNMIQRFAPRPPFETRLSGAPQGEGAGFPPGSQDEGLSFRPGFQGESSGSAAPCVSDGRRDDPATLATDDWREDAALFGPDRRLVGIFCAPPGGPVDGKAVVFLNSGGVYHIGWARMFVDMARRLTASGVASLRMDLTGVGDSLSPAGPDRAPLYDRGLKSDVEAAIDWLEARGVREVSLFGACSGAYQAFHAAIEDRRVTRIALVNTVCFVYGPTYAMQIEAWRRTKAADIGMKLASAENEGDAEPHAARAVLFNLAKKLVKAGLVQATDATYAIRRRIPGLNPVERWFGELAERGAEALLVYSENDPGLAELERHLGERGRAPAPLPGVRTTTIPQADHELTPQSAREALAAALGEFVSGRRAA